MQSPSLSKEDTYAVQAKKTAGRYDGIQQTSCPFPWKLEPGTVVVSDLTEEELAARDLSEVGIKQNQCEGSLLQRTTS